MNFDAYRATIRGSLANNVSAGLLATSKQLRTLQNDAADLWPRTELKAGNNAA